MPKVSDFFLRIFSPEICPSGYLLVKYYDAVPGLVCRTEAFSSLWKMKSNVYLMGILMAYTKQPLCMICKMTMSFFFCRILSGWFTGWLLIGNNIQSNWFSYKKKKNLLKYYCILQSYYEITQLITENDICALSRTWHLICKTLKHSLKCFCTNVYKNKKIMSVDQLLWPRKASDETELSMTFDGFSFKKKLKNQIM